MINIAGGPGPLRPRYAGSSGRELLIRFHLTLLWSLAWLGCGAEVHPCVSRSACDGSAEEVAACCLEGASAFGEREALCIARGTARLWYPDGDQGCELVARELPGDDGTPTGFKVQVVPLGPVTCATGSVPGVVVSAPDGVLTAGYTLHADGPCVPR